MLYWYISIVYIWYYFSTCLAQFFFCTRIGLNFRSNHFVIWEWFVCCWWAFFTVFGKLQACTGICAPPNQIPATHLKKKVQFVHTQWNYLYAVTVDAASAAVTFAIVCVFGFSLSIAFLLNVFFFLHMQLCILFKPKDYFKGLCDWIKLFSGFWLYFDSIYCY